MNSDLTQEQRYWRKRIFVLTWLGYAGFYFCRKNLSVIKPELAGIGYTDYVFATITTGYSLLYMLGQFSNGMLSDKFGPRLIVGCGLFLSATANIFLGLSVSWTLLFIALACLNGYAQSTGWSGLVKNMSNWFRPHERGRVMAWWGTNYVLGGFLATIFATYCMTDLPFFKETLGFKRALFIPALVLLGVATLYSLLNRNTPTDAGIPEVVHEKLGDDNENQNNDNNSPTKRGSKAILKTVLANPTVWLIAIMYFFLKMTRYSFLFWLPDYMVTNLGYGAGEAGYTSSIYELVGFTGAVSAGYFSDKLFQSRRMPVGALMLWVLALVFFLHPTLSAWGRVWNMVGIGLIGYFTYGPDTLMTGAGAQDAGSKEGAATAAGVINGVGSCGQLLSQFVTAYVKINYGWNALFYLFGCMVFIGGCILAMKWNYKALELET